MIFILLINKSPRSFTNVKNFTVLEKKEACQTFMDEILLIMP